MRKTPPYLKVGKEPSFHITPPESLLVVGGVDHGLAFPVAPLPAARIAVSDSIIDGFQRQLQLARERDEADELRRVQAEFAAYLESNRAVGQLLQQFPPDLGLDVCLPLSQAEQRRVSMLLKSSVGTPPASIQEALSRGCGWFQVHAFDCALQVFERALATFEVEYGETPARIQLRVNLGYCLLALGRAEEAKQVFLRVTEDAPNKLGARRGHGRALMELGESAAAVVAFNRALELTPRDPDINYRLGTALLAEGRTDQSLESLMCAHRSQPKDLAILQMLGRALAQAGRWDEAAGTLDLGLGLSRSQGSSPVKLPPFPKGPQKRSRTRLARRRKHLPGLGFLYRIPRGKLIFVSLVAGHYLLAALGL